MNIFSSKTYLLGQAEAALVLPKRGQRVGTTILIEKLPAAHSPQTTAEWHETVFARNKHSLRDLEERTFTVGDQIRYVTEYKVAINEKELVSFSLMATSVNGELYLFIYQNDSDNFAADIKGVHLLFRTMRIR